jgi:hypothetical protein
MENRNQTSERAEVIETKQSPIHTTTLSKYLAMGLFVALPFLGGWIGYTHAPEKIIETERIVIQEVEKKRNNFQDATFSSDELTVVEAPELVLSEQYLNLPPFHIFHNQRHLISIAGPCQVDNEGGTIDEVSVISEPLDFPDEEQYEVISKVTCFQVAAGTETLLLQNMNSTVGTKRIIHYPVRDCAMSSPDCVSKGKPISL